MDYDLNELKKIAQELLPFVEGLVSPEKKLWDLAIDEVRDSSLKMYDFIENQANHPEIFGQGLSETARVFLQEIDESHASREEELKRTKLTEGR
ncbi:hypothetical protein KAR91_76410 [Candidatus Pacearchaeota archaeon]|nr:hypothetical protein [Candidatus Pacearchaeota archaeon]